MSTSDIIIMLSILWLQIFHYNYPTSTILHQDFASRLEWGGTKKTADLQVGAIYIRNVTFNDTGTYTCTFQRTLFLSLSDEHVTITKTVELIVLAKRNVSTLYNNDLNSNTLIFTLLHLLNWLINIVI